MHINYILITDVLWWFLEPLMQKNDNFPFLKKLVETVKQAVDAIDPFNDTINERMWVWTCSSLLRRLFFITFDEIQKRAEPRSITNRLCQHTKKMQTYQEHTSRLKYVAWIINPCAPRYAICDLAFGVINCKCSNVKLPPFPGEVKLSKKFFAPPEKLVSKNSTNIVRSLYDLNHRF